MRFLLLNILLYVGLTVHGQDTRDAIIGSYLVNFQADGGVGNIFSDTLFVTKSTTDSNQIHIQKAYSSGNYFYDFNPQDSSFAHPAFPNLIYGGFHANDSVYLYEHLFNSMPSMPPYYYEHWGFKIPFTVGIEYNLTNENRIRILTDPANTNVRVQYHDFKWTTLLDLYDVSGKKVWSQQHFSSTGKGSVSIDLTSLKTGIYILRARNNGRVLSKKIIKPSQ
ncbi:MAG: T9SS type A sorting domain-containing protein [Flavobacteriales bacterium]